MTLARRFLFSFRSAPHLGGSPDFKMFSGSWKWAAEKGVTVGALGTVGAAVFGKDTIGNPSVDALLAGLLPLHCYFTMDAMLADYVPAYRQPKASRLCSLLLVACTATSIYALLSLNWYGAGVTKSVHSFFHRNKG